MLKKMLRAKVVEFNKMFILAKFSISETNGKDAGKSEICRIKQICSFCCARWIGIWFETKKIIYYAKGKSKV